MSELPATPRGLAIDNQEGSVGQATTAINLCPEVRARGI